MANTAITLLMELQGQKKSLTQSSPAFPYAHPLILITIFFFFLHIQCIQFCMEFVWAG